MTDTTTIAAGEIREQHSCLGPEARFYPLNDGPGVYVEAERGGIVYVTRASLSPAEARDFARAILAAADWAERQGG